ncbi:MAG: ankyrin repeat domain-containing protein [Marinobacter sp.]|uniref:ankyrin repeat domain-containing protein n=1 Tax=Marinobacter sp. TaxID=50741 RepID=UPI00329A6E2B
MASNKPGKPQSPGNQKDEDAIAFAQGLFELARNGGAGPLSVMLNAGVPVDIRTSTGDSLLMLACSNGHADTARLLLENGANPDLRNDQLQTPLMAAARSNQGAVIECLLEAGAQKALADADGHSALNLATSAGADEAIRALT